MKPITEKDIKVLFTEEDIQTRIKELKKSTDESVQGSLIQIVKLSMYIFAKIGIRRPIYCDYMFKKAIPDKISDVYLKYYKNDKFKLFFVMKKPEFFKLFF